MVLSDPSLHSKSLIITSTIVVVFVLFFYVFCVLIEIKLRCNFLTSYQTKYLRLTIQTYVTDFRDVIYSLRRVQRRFFCLLPVTRLSSFCDGFTHCVPDPLQPTFYTLRCPLYFRERSTTDCGPGIFGETKVMSQDIYLLFFLISFHFICDLVLKNLL